MNTGEWSSSFAAFVGDWAVFEGDVEEEDLHDEHYHGLDEEGDVVFGAGEVEDAGRMLGRFLMLQQSGNCKSQE